MSCCNQKGYPTIDAGLRELAKADIRVAHNGIGYDEPVIVKLEGPHTLSQDRIIDTLILARLVFPELHIHGPNPHKVYAKKSHKLEDWGRRLGVLKDGYKGGWTSWSPEMQSYCAQDVQVLKTVYQYLMHPSRRPPSLAVSIEMAFAKIISRQERRGVTFDMDAALDIAAILHERIAKIETTLIETFGSWWAYKTRSSDASDEKDEDDTEEVDEDEANRRLAPIVKTVAKTRYTALKDFPNVRTIRYSPKTGKRLKDHVGPPKCLYEVGASYVEIKRVQFNPGSREHVRRILKDRYGWLPKRFTKATTRNPNGSPIVDDGVLQDLADQIPECRMLADYFLLKKRVGMLADGRQAWIKKAVLDPSTNEYRIHGRVNTGGALGGRCTHSSPNLAQVPSHKKEYAGTPDELEKKQGLQVLEGIPPLRSLFVPRRGYKMAGFDASSGELRMLGSYLAQYDEGLYASIVSDPDGDPHAWTRDTIGVDVIGPGSDGREKAKTVIYAKIYGGGKEKIGSIISPKAGREEKIRIGNAVDEAIGSRFQALYSLQQSLMQTVQETGQILGLDGRRIPIRKAFAALNTLLQSALAIVMKMALIILDGRLQARGLKPGLDYEFVLNVHDEAQAEVRDDPGVLTIFREEAQDCIVAAGRKFKLKCALAGSVKIGNAWSETH
jgi:DNA polymerase I-like protein with 3'-5' exonuclease and polymerase domains